PLEVQTRWDRPGIASVRTPAERSLVLRDVARVLHFRLDFVLNLPRKLRAAHIVPSQARVGRLRSEGAPRQSGSLKSKPLFLNLPGSNPCLLERFGVQHADPLCVGEEPAVGISLSQLQAMLRA